MTNLISIFGTYNYRARLNCALLFIAPILLEMFLVFPQFRDLYTAIPVIVVIYVFLNVFIILTRLKGSEAFSSCYKNKLLPAQQYLLPNNENLDKITKQRYYDFFKQNITGWEMLEYNEADNETSRSKKEVHNKDMANSAINWLIAQTRDCQKFYLLHEENMNLAASYNMLGLKLYAILLNLALLVTNITVLYFSFHPNIIFTNEYASIIISTVINILFLAFWIAFVNDKLVKKSGHKYAKAILSCCDSPYLNKKE